MIDKPNREIQVRDEKGKLVKLRYNEPRPDLESPKPASRLVSVEKLGLVGLRIQAEWLLDQSCGEDHTAKVVALGPQVAGVLIKIAGTKESCDCSCVRRSGAVRALGYFPHAETVDFLNGILTDNSEDLGIRAQAAISLGRIGSPSCVARLMVVLKTDGSAAMRRSAAKALGLSRSVETLGALEQAVARDRDPTVKYQAYTSLLHIERLHGQKMTRVKPPPVPKRGKPERRPPPGGPALSRSRK